MGALSTRILRDPEVAQDLCANAVGTQHLRAGRARVAQRPIARADRLGDIERALVRAQQHDDAVAVERDPLERAAQRPAVTLLVGTDEIAHGVLQVHADQRSGRAPERPADERKVHGAVHVVFVAVQAERPEVRLDLPLGDALHRALLLEAIADQVGDRAELQAMQLRELLELRPARHGAVFVQDLDDHGRRLEPGDAHEVAAGFGVPGSGQHATGLRHQREDVARLAQVLGTGVRGDGRADRVRPVVCRDARRNPLRRLDRQREVRRLVGVGLAHHQRQPQLPAAIAIERQADQATAEPGHEIDVLGANLRRGHDEVAFVFAVLVVHEDDHPALPDILDNLVDGTKRSHAVYVVTLCL